MQDGTAPQKGDAEGDRPFASLAVSPQAGSSTPACTCSLATRSCQQLLQAASSAGSTRYIFCRSRETAVGTTARNHGKFVLPARGKQGDHSTTTRVESWLLALHSLTAYDAAVKDTAQGLMSEVLGKVLTGTQTAASSTADRPHNMGAEVTQD